MAMMPKLRGMTRSLSSASTACPSRTPRRWPAPPPCSRLEHQIDRKDAYRLAWAFVEHFVHSYSEPP